jgi:hypothetical protein
MEQFRKGFLGRLVNKDNRREGTKSLSKHEERMIRNQCIAFLFLVEF